MTDATEPSPEEILAKIPDQIKSRFRQPGFAKWGRTFHPILEVGPYDVLPGEVRALWMKRFETERDDPNDMERMVYWYGDWSFSFLPKSKVLTYEEGVERGLHKLSDRILQKVKTAKPVSGTEKMLIQGLEELHEERQRPPSERLRRINPDYVAQLGNCESQPTSASISNSARQDTRSQEAAGPSKRRRVEPRTHTYSSDLDSLLASSSDDDDDDYLEPHAAEKQNRSTSPSRSTRSGTEAGSSRPHHASVNAATPSNQSGQGARNQRAVANDPNVGSRRGSQPVHEIVASPTAGLHETRSQNTLPDKAVLVCAVQDAARQFLEGISHEMDIKSTLPPIRLRYRDSFGIDVETFTRLVRDWVRKQRHCNIWFEEHVDSVLEDASQAI